MLVSATEKKGSWELKKLYDFDGGRIGFGGPYWRKRKQGQPFFAQMQLRGGKNSGKFVGNRTSGKNDTGTDRAAGAGSDQGATGGAGGKKPEGANEAH